jgi:hypothetical protein
MEPNKMTETDDDIDETPAGYIAVTYEIVTPESAEEGDAAERGWEDEQGAEYTLSEAIEKLRGLEPSSTAFHPGVWYSDCDGDTDYRTGEVKYLSYHLVDFSVEDQRAIFDAVTKNMIGIFR